jgi:hypothetical protein
MAQDRKKKTRSVAVKIKTYDKFEIARSDYCRRTNIILSKLDFLDMIIEKGIEVILK